MNTHFVTCRYAISNYMQNALTMLVHNKYVLLKNIFVINSTYELREKLHIDYQNKWLLMFRSPTFIPIAK